MIIDICSDLHVDNHMSQTSILVQPGEGPSHWPVGQVGKRESFFPFDFGWYKSEGASTIIIAGDVSNSTADTIGVLKDASQHYENIIFVDGNHEHYGAPAYGGVVAKTSVHEAMQEFREAEKTIKGLVYLDGLEKVSATIDGVTFLGANTWYDWKCYEDRGISFIDGFAGWDDFSNDAKQINFGDYSFPSSIGNLQVVNMTNEMQRISEDSSIENVVVVTHSAPLPELLRWDDTKHEWNVGGASYCNSMLSGVIDSDVNEKIRLWVYGHTHDRQVVAHKHITMINNAYGYPREPSSFLWSSASVEI